MRDEFEEMEEIIHEPFLGQLRWMYHRGQDKGIWRYANGQLLNIPNYTAFFTIIRNSFGGDPRYNFALPDLREMVPGALKPGESRVGPPAGTIVPYIDANGARCKIAIEKLSSCVLPFKLPAGLDHFPLVPCMAIVGHFPPYSK